MHSTDTKSQFLELRAKGWSLSRIAIQIGVSKRTLVDWNQQHALELETLRAVEFEAIEERILASHEQELTRLAAHQKAIEQELLGRSYAGLPTDKLFRLSAMVRGQIETMRQKTMLHEPPSQPEPPAT